MPSIWSFDQFIVDRRKGIHKSSKAKYKNHNIGYRSCNLFRITHYFSSSFYEGSTSCTSVLL